MIGRVVTKKAHQHWRLRQGPVALVVIIPAIAVLPPAATAAENKIISMSRTRGTCFELAVKIDGKQVDLDKGCKRVVQTQYADGRSGFYFASGDFDLAFTGKSGLNLDADNFVQAVDGVMLSDKGRSPGFAPAVGECEIEEIRATPQGAPARTVIRCHARAKGMEFWAHFNVDIGAKPQIERFP